LQLSAKFILVVDAANMLLICIRMFNALLFLETDHDYMNRYRSNDAQIVESGIWHFSLLCVIDITVDNA